MHAWHTPWLGWWLALALVLAPALGRMHEVLHAPISATTTAPLHTQADGGHHGHLEHHGIAAWFDGHDALACLVLDQLGHGNSDTPLVTIAAHAQPSAPPDWVCQAHLLPPPPRVFMARAPPQDFMA